MKKHFTEQYLINPNHPVSVCLIGCGGTGTQVLSALARMNQALIKLDHPGLHVTVYDDDMITPANVGRQLFSESEIGLNKAVCMVTRMNRFYGFTWDAVPERHSKQLDNIIITCVDNISTRVELSKYLSGINAKKHYQPMMRPYYWLDFGNTVDSGQVVLGTVGKIEQPKSKQFKVVSSLPFVTKKFDYTKIKDEDAGPSCSLAGALGRQDLFINSTLALLGCDILWKMFRELGTDISGLYLNLKTMNVNPMRL